MNVDDTKILAKNLRSGNEQAFVSLFTTYFPRLCRFASVYIPNKNDAQDIAQGVFIKLWEARNLIREDTSIPAYLLTITKNSCLDYLKHQQIEIKYHQKVLQQQSETELNYNSLNRLDVDLMDYEEINGIIERTMENLSPQCKQVFKMSRYDNFTNSEISEKLGISQKAVEANITRALKIFRSELKDYLSLLILLNIPLN